MIYFLKHPTEPVVKIGYASNVELRLDGLRTTYGNLKVINSIKGNTSLENRIHNYLAEYRYHDFKDMDGCTEWFKATPPVMDFALNPDITVLPKPQETEMTTVRMSLRSKIILNLIKRQTGKTTQDKAFLKFIRENNPELYAKAEKIEQMELELLNLRRGTKPTKS